MTEPCANGCTFVTLDGSREPSPATHGLLCTQCVLRLREALDSAPEVVGLLRARVGREPGAAGGEPVTGTPDLQIPIRPGALEEADDLYALVWTWCIAAVESLGVAGPQRAHEAIAAGRDPSRLSAQVTPGVAAIETSRATNWLVGHLPRIVHLPLVVDMSDEVIRAVDRGAVRTWKTAPKQYPARRACEVCTTRTVKVEWLPDGGADVRCWFCHDGVSLDAIDVERLIPGEEKRAESAA